MLHPATKEWLRWRNGEPSWFDHPGTMPLDIATGFEYLCIKYGKQDLAPPRAGHDAAVNSELAKIANFHRASGMF